jgi:hypothetical protein
MPHELPKVPVQGMGYQETLAVPSIRDGLGEECPRLKMPARFERVLSDAGEKTSGIPAQREKNSFLS